MDLQDFFNLVRPNCRRLDFNEFLLVYDKSFPTVFNLFTEHVNLVVIQPRSEKHCLCKLIIYGKEHYYWLDFFSEQVFITSYNDFMKFLVTIK